MGLRKILFAVSFIFYTNVFILLQASYATNTVSDLKQKRGPESRVREGVERIINLVRSQAIQKTASYLNRFLG